MAQLLNLKQKSVSPLDYLNGLKNVTTGAKNVPTKSTGA